MLEQGQRCNVTNNLALDEFINSLTLKNKRFLYPSLYTFGPEQVIEYFKENNLELVLENNFKYFPKTNKSQSILDRLTNNIELKRIRTNSNVKSIKKSNDIFELALGNGVLKTKNLIVATGSKSFPTTGSTGFGLNIAKSFAIEYQDFTPAETHIYSNQIKKEFADLQGTAIQNAILRIKNTSIKYQGDILFTHYGLSGPAIYHLSEFIYDETLKGDVFLQFNITNKTEHDIDILLESNDIFILKHLEKMVSKRLARKVLDYLKIDNKKVLEISKKDISRIKDFLFRFEIKVTKVEDKEKAYVNKGGILLKELNPSTLESKKVSGLYFVGETINIHGPIGGYNITIAFATGKLAGLDIYEKSIS